MNANPKGMPRVNPCLRNKETGTGLAPVPQTQTNLWSSHLCSSIQQSISDLRATARSAGLDLGSTSHTVLRPEMGVQVLPTGIFGLLPKDTFGLIVVHSGAILNGLQMFPGVIDNNYLGEIKVMVSSPKLINTIIPGQRFGQLFLLPLLSTSNKGMGDIRDSRGFDTLNVYWSEIISAQKPLMTLKLDDKKFSGLVDTGTDVTIIKREDWPITSSLDATLTHLKEIGKSQNLEKN